jgi:hypothetical protein
MNPPGELPAFVFPEPDYPSNPDSGTSFTAKEARQLRAVLMAITEYIRIEYARCGKQAEPPGPPF